MSLTYSLHQPSQALPKATIVAAVIVIHVAAFIALNSGFARWPSMLKPSVFKLVHLAPEPPKPVSIPAPPPPKELLNKSFVPPQPDLLKPDIKIASDTIPPIPHDDGILLGKQTEQPTLPLPSRVTVLHRVDPLYPASAERAGEEGVVLLEVQIDARGKVLDVNVVQSSGFDRLDAAALKAVKHWRFAPLSGGARVRVPIKFKLDMLRR